MTLGTNGLISVVTRKPVFGVFAQVRLKQVCSADETRWSLEISAIAGRGIILSRQRTTEGADQTARMFAYCKTGFLTTWF